MRRESEQMLILKLDDAMRVLQYNGYLKEGYDNPEDGLECVRNELEQKCYMVPNDFLSTERIERLSREQIDQILEESYWQFIDKADNAINDDHDETKYYKWIVSSIAIAKIRKTFDDCFRRSKEDKT